MYFVQFLCTLNGIRHYLKDILWVCVGFNIWRFKKKLFCTYSSYFVWNRKFIRFLLFFNIRKFDLWHLSPTWSKQPALSRLHVKSRWGTKCSKVKSSQGCHRDYVEGTSDDNITHLHLKKILEGEMTGTTGQGEYSPNLIITLHAYLSIEFWVKFNII